jgi:hypothetical protein
VSGAGVPWDVPVHIVSRDTELLARFAAQGFQPGLEPSRAPLGGMHEFTAMLLAGFGMTPAPGQTASVNVPAAAALPAGVRP